jgi:hypothetical protein
MAISIVVLVGLLEALYCRTVMLASIIAITID